ncbi:hypothetical protein GCK32_009260 [Trichostrongylus colubriformis]|uniref:Uncharacterized protein n=1 Tax=Trichostrongylus colubriformis TaxID=6319 RepID=A0AAN8FQK4_TRICO
MLLRFLCVASLLFVGISSRSIAVKGSLKCGKYPAGQVLVRLWDSSRVEGTSDELIEQTHSDSEGEFSLAAHGTLKNGWQPLLSIHHDCDDAKNAGRRMLKFRLPLSYVEDRDTPKRTFDLGIFNLETHIKESEERVEQITRKRRHPHRSHRSAKRHRNGTTPAPLDQFDSPEERIEPWTQILKVQTPAIIPNPGDPDDLLDENFTDKDGRFALTGTTRELTSIEPVLYIYHDCDDGIRPCQKRITIEVPKRFIHGGTPSQWYDVGTMELTETYPNQDRNCDN